jgi:hypothetical protein
MLIALAELAVRKYPSAVVHVSELLLRKSEPMNTKVDETNRMLMSHDWHPNVRLVRHAAITTDHLIDERHLAYRYSAEDREQMSGSMWLATSLFQSILNFMPSKRALLYSRLRTSDLYPAN